MRSFIVMSPASARYRTVCGSFRWEHGGGYAASKKVTQTRVGASDVTFHPAGANWMLRARQGTRTEAADVAEPPGRREGLALALDGDARHPDAFLQAPAGGREADAEDLVQDCLIAYHIKRATYDPSLPFTTWAYAVARYKLIDHLRRQGRSQPVLFEDALRVVTDHALERGAIRQDLMKLLSLLPARQRQLVQDVRVTGYSFAEAAARHGLTEGAAKVSVHRSMKILTARVSADED